jgi:hypothetical protein
MAGSERRRRVVSGAFLVGLIMFCGCAPAYRCYSGCCVNCKYCAPPPLAYVHYPNCVCHACVASGYLSDPTRPLSANSAPVEQDAEDQDAESTDGIKEQIDASGESGMFELLDPSDQAQ